MIKKVERFALMQNKQMQTTYCTVLIKRANIKHCEVKNEQI